MLTAFHWGAGFLVPRAAGERDAFAVTCALLTTVIALAAFLLFGQQVF